MHRILIPLGLKSIFVRWLLFTGHLRLLCNLLEMVVRKTSPALYRLAGYLPAADRPLNCAVLGVALLNISLGHVNFMQSALCRFFRRRRFLISVMVSSRRSAERLAAAGISLSASAVTRLRWRPLV